MIATADISHGIKTQKLYAPFALDSYRRKKRKNFRHFDMLFPLFWFLLLFFHLSCLMATNLTDCESVFHFKRTTNRFGALYWWHDYSLDYASVCLWIKWPRYIQHYILYVNWQIDATHKWSLPTDFYTSQWYVHVCVLHIRIQIHI